MKKLFKRLKEDYMLMTYGGEKSQIFQISVMIWFFPAIVLQNNKSKLVRFTGVILMIPWMMLTLPIAAPLIFIGIFQGLWQDI